MDSMNATPRLPAMEEREGLVAVVPIFILRILCALLFLFIVPAAKTAPSTRVSPAPEPARISAPLENPLRSFWNDPQWTKRFLGSYGFNSDIEPKLTAEELIYYKEKLAPLLRADPQKAADELAAKAKPDSSALFDFMLGQIDFQSGNLTNATRHYEAALAKFPDFRRAHRNLALALARQENLAEAIPHLTRTIELGGGDGQTFGLLGFCYLSRENYLSAESAYRNAILYNPETLDWKLGLVKCLIALENFRPANALLNEMLLANPDQETLWALAGGNLPPAREARAGRGESRDPPQYGQSQRRQPHAPR